MLVSRNVLRAVDRDVNPSVEKRVLDRSNESALSPRRVRGTTIASRRDRDELRLYSGSAKCRSDDRCLGERKRAGARPYTQRTLAGRAGQSQG
jgi:hypothetical protein